MKRNVIVIAIMAMLLAVLVGNVVRASTPPLPMFEALNFPQRNGEIVTLGIFSREQIPRIGIIPIRSVEIIEAPAPFGTVLISFTVKDGESFQVSGQACRAGKGLWVDKVGDECRYIIPMFAKKDE